MCKVSCILNHLWTNWHSLKCVSYLTLSSLFSLQQISSSDSHHDSLQLGYFLLPLLHLQWHSVPVVIPCFSGSLVDGSEFVTMAMQMKYSTPNTVNTNPSVQMINSQQMQQQLQPLQQPSWPIVNVQLRNEPIQVRPTSPLVKTATSTISSSSTPSNNRESLGYGQSKGLLNGPGQNNCFLNCAVQVSQRLGGGNSFDVAWSGWGYFVRYNLQRPENWREKGRGSNDRHLMREWVI